MKTIRQIIVFTIGRQTFGMDVDLVTALMKDQNITPVPNSIEHVTGVTYIHGECTPVYSIRGRFGLRGEDRVSSGSILLARFGTSNIALPIDGVKEIEDLKPGDIQEVPAILAGNGSDNAYISGVAHVSGMLISIIDPNLLITPEKKEELKAFVEKLKSEAGAEENTDNEQA